MIWLVCTTDSHDGLSEHYRRLVSSLQVVAGQLDLTLFTLFQRPGAEAMPAIAGMPGFVRPVMSDTRLSLSQARNRILRAIAAEEGFTEDALILFPDDDCWFTDAYLPIVGQMFAQDPQLQYWFCRYGSSPAADPALFGATRPARASDVVRRSSSITLVIRGWRMARIGLFDEGLGVGSALNGGEDTDFAVRLYRSGGKGLACRHALIGHRDWNPANRARYFAGSATVLARNAWASPGLAGEYLRKMISGLSLVARGKLSLSDFALGLRALRWPGVRPGPLSPSLSLKG